MMTRYVALITTGRLETEVSFDADSFEDAYAVILQDKQQLVERTAHLDAGPPRIVYLRERKQKKK